MKVCILTFLLLLGFTCSIYTQVDETRGFVFLRNGQVVYNEHFWMRQGALINNATDRQNIKPKDIKFVNAENGFFAYTKGIRRWGAPHVAKRTISGQINLFESQIIYIEDGFYGSPGSLFTKKKYYNYYNTAYSDIQRVSYKALYPSFSSNPESLAYLNRYRSAHIWQHTLNTTGYLMQVGAGVLILVNILPDLKNNSSTFSGSSFILPIGIALTGYGFSLTSNVFGAKKTEHLRRAFIKYNGI